MHLAAEKGKHLRLRPFLSGNVDALDESGLTPLFLASSNGHLRCVTMLLDAKADVNALSKSKTALMAAAEFGHLDVVNTLIEARADLNTVTTAESVTQKVSALHFACQTPGNELVIAALLAARALVNRESIVSPLAFAIYGDCLETMKLLIAARADLQGSRYQIPPLDNAIISGNLDAVKLFVGSNPDFISDSDNPLFTAITIGNIDIDKFLISAGADVTMNDSSGQSCLHYLASSFRLDDTYLAPVSRDHHRRLPHDYPGILRVLVDAKADVSARGRWGHTPLTTAVVDQNVEAVHALLAVGANPNDIGGNGQSALMLATITGHLQVMMALLNAGADVNFTHEGYTALDIAVGLKDPDIKLIGLLRYSGGLSWYDLMMKKNELVRAIDEDDIDLVNKLVADAGDAEKKDALRFAVQIPTQSNTLASIKCLLAAGTNPSLPCRQSSLVGLASAEGKTDVVRALVDADADISAKNDDGRTPLQVAAQGKHREVVVLLLATANELKKANKYVHSICCRPFTRWNTPILHFTR